MNAIFAIQHISLIVTFSRIYIYGFHRTYFIIELSTLHSTRVPSHPPRTAATPVRLWRDGRLPVSERNELSLNARGSIHSARVAQEVHSVGSYVADRPRVVLCVHRSAHVCTMCLHRVNLHTGYAIGDDTEIERISSPSQCLRCAKSRCSFGC